MEPLKFTVIIPARNAEATLGHVLDAVRRNCMQPEEIIVADDGSSDNTASIARRYGCRLVKVNIGKGPMQPRFEGAEAALSPILVFVDADVRVRTDTFKRVTAWFKNTDIHAVTGRLSEESNSKSFFTNFKNEYMSYIFSKQPEDTHFLYGSIWAIRKSSLAVFEPVSEPFGSLVSDSEMGFRLALENKRAVLDKDILVDHLKEYDLRGIIENDFKIPFMFALMYLRNFDFRSLWLRRRFSHVSYGQVFSLALALCGLVCGLLALVFNSPLPALVGAGAFAGFYGYWRSLIRQLSRRGMLFVGKSVIFLPLDALVMLSGMLSGFVYGVVKTIWPSKPACSSRPRPAEAVLRPVSHALD